MWHLEVGLWCLLCTISSVMEALEPCLKQRIEHISCPAGRDRLSVCHTNLVSKGTHSAPGSWEAVGGKAPEKCTLEQSRTLLSLCAGCYSVLEKASWTPGWVWMCICVVHAQMLPFTCKSILLSDKQKKPFSLNHWALQTLPVRHA